MKTSFFSYDFPDFFHMFKQIFANPSIEKAVNDFNSDWYDVYGEGKGICDL